LVMYRLPRTQIAGRQLGGGAANYLFQGDWIGRIIATQGQQVSIDNGKWLVDGIISKWQPTNIASFQDGTSWTIGDGRAFILSEALVNAGAQINPAELESVFVLPLSSIAGRLYFRSLPLSQMSVLR
jgi:hypothetical protein